MKSWWREFIDNTDSQPYETLNVVCRYVDVHDHMQGYHGFGPGAAGPIDGLLGYIDL